jgi:hypothetical protein
VGEIEAGYAHPRLQQFLQYLNGPGLGSQGADNLDAVLVSLLLVSTLVLVKVNNTFVLQTLDGVPESTESSPS